MVLLSEILDWYFHGESGKTIFSAPFRRGPLDYDFDEGSKLIKKLAEAGDTRSMVLLSAMICELYVDRLLSILLPKYEKQLSDSRDLQFSTKIKLLESFAVVPSHLTKAAHLVRDVRNAFAHNLDVTTLDDIDSKIMRKLRGLYLQRKIRTDAGPDDLTNLFLVISYLATDVLNSYRANVGLLASAIRQPAFATMLEAINDERVEAQMATNGAGSAKT